MIENKYYVYKLIDPRSNQPFYIGKGKNDRMYDHEKEVRNGNHLSNKKLNNRIRELLSENLNIEYKQVYFTNDNDEAYRKETELIRKYGLENLCNLTEVAWPIEPTEETRRKISEAKKDCIPWNKGIAGAYRSEETKRKISNGRKGIIFSEETKEKMSNSQKGKVLSKEHKRKIGDGNKNKIISEEIKQKISKSLKGHYISEETKKKMSESAKGKRKPPRSEEHKRKLSESHKGRNKGISYEELYGKEKADKIRQKMSKSAKNRKKI